MVAASLRRICKNSGCADAGLPSYWVVETARVSGSEALALSEPFPCTWRLRK